MTSPYQIDHSQLFTLKICYQPFCCKPCVLFNALITFSRRFVVDLDQTPALALQGVSDVNVRISRFGNIERQCYFLKEEIIRSVFGGCSCGAPNVCGHPCHHMIAVTKSVAELEVSLQQTQFHSGGQPLCGVSSTQGISMTVLSP